MDGWMPACRRACKGPRGSTQLRRLDQASKEDCRSFGAQTGTSRWREHLSVQQGRDSYCAHFTEEQTEAITHLVRG